jgi:hypothetical protein
LSIFNDFLNDSSIYEHEEGTRKEKKAML